MPSREELWRLKRLREQERLAKEEAENKRLLAEYLQAKSIKQALVTEEESRTLQKWINLHKGD